eukprot:470360-Pelagomonas_calceolata.AAC.4
MKVLAENLALRPGLNGALRASVPAMQPIWQKKVQFQIRSKWPMLNDLSCCYDKKMLQCQIWWGTLGECAGWCAHSGWCWQLASPGTQLQAWSPNFAHSCVIKIRQIKNFKWLENWPRWNMECIYVEISNTSLSLPPYLSHHHNMSGICKPAKNVGTQIFRLCVLELKKP